jgi:hypothetical protein
MVSIIKYLRFHNWSFTGRLRKFTSVSSERGEKETKKEGRKQGRKGRKEGSSS